MSFGATIIKWYEIHKRDLPWRKTRNPYLIWLSEIILQQTRIDQGLAYYYKFAENYPDINILARAKESEVLKLWQGLGYYSRAKNLHATARIIAKDFGGKFPEDYPTIRALKGIGDYTAAAITSFSFNLPYPVVDGNVYRLLSRYYGIRTPIDSPAGKKEFSKLAFELLNGFTPSVYNQAIMEFGARQCKPANPDCSICPLNISCFAFSKKSVKDFPVKKNKVKSRDRFFNYIVVRKGNSYFIRKRTGKDIWQGLHDFPLIETTKKVSAKNLINSASWKKLFAPKKVQPTHVSNEYKHVLSHQTIYAFFFEVVVSQKEFDNMKAGLIKVTDDSLKKYAIPRLVDKYLKERHKLFVN